MKILEILAKKNNVFLFLWGLSFSLDIIALMVIYFQNSLSGNNVALKYSVNTGVLWYGNGNNLLLIPFFGIILNFINWFIYQKLKNSYEFFAYSITIVNIIVQFLLFLAVLFLAHIN